VVGRSISKFLNFFIFKFALALSLSIFNCQFSIAQNLVPKPVSVIRGEGVVTLEPFRAIGVSHSELTPLASYLADHMPVGRVTLSLNNDNRPTLPAGGYRLEVKADRTTISGTDYNGVWNGIQTLLQLCPAEIYSNGSESGSHPGGVNYTTGPITLPVVTIEDWPAMSYRGVMLDVARTFVPKEEVKRLIDNISHHKINKFHWHLADDEGWRVEIKSFPRLTEVGAWRGGDSRVMPVYGAWERRYGGFYTQDEIREVVAYAAVRGVEVIPEIDLPGHSRAAAIAYPSILCDYTPDLKASADYDTRNVWCVAREENYAMLDSIVREVAALFPSPVMHLGGDEVLTGQWKQCTHCKALMAEKKLTDAARLQDIFMARVIDIAARHGKKAGVWNEAAKSGTIPRTTTVWGWETPAAARAVAAKGYPTVFCAGSYFYFDMRQSARDIGHTWAGVVPLEKVYGFTPAAVGFTAAEEANVAGVEATFFSELLLENSRPGEEHGVRDFLDYQLFPRVCALAEVGWTPAASRSWSDFQSRLTGRPAAATTSTAATTAAASADKGPSHFDRLAAMGIGYRAAEPSPSAAHFGRAATPAAPLKKPAATLTSSLSANAKYPFANAAAYISAARTNAAPVENDWFLWKFAAPVAASRIDIRTGHNHLQRCGVAAGRVEVSYNGTDFESAARFHDLRATVELDPARPIRAIKIVNEAHGNGENTIIIQPLKIN
jgi:hexosaminidase